MIFDFKPYEFLFKVSMILYLPVVFGLKYYVSTLPKETKEYLNEKLTPYWVIWCFCLSGFSTVGTLITGYYILFDNFETDFFESHAYRFCNYFLLSKIPELLDTVFIVLRSKPLVLIQFYHHLCTLYIAYLASHYQCDKSVYFIFMNYFVHGPMYLYFGVYAICKSWAKDYANLINFLQVLQMLIATYLTVYYFQNTSKMRCVNFPVDEVEKMELFLKSIFMYGSYLILFTSLFFERSKRNSQVKKQ